MTLGNTILTSRIAGLASSSCAAPRPAFTGTKTPLLILLFCQLARVLFGPNVPLLTVIGAQKQNAMLAVSALIVRVIANVLLAPAYGVFGAAIAVATVFWLLSCSIMLARIAGLRTDAIYLLGLSSARQEPAA